MACPTTILDTATSVPISCVNEIVTSKGCSDYFKIGPQLERYGEGLLPGDAVMPINKTTGMLTTTGTTWGGLKTVLNTMFNNSTICKMGDQVGNYFEDEDEAADADGIIATALQKNVDAYRAGLAAAAAGGGPAATAAASAAAALAARARARTTGRPAATPAPAAAAAAAANLVNPIIGAGTVGIGAGDINDILDKITKLQTIEQNLIAQLDEYIRNSVAGTSGTDATIVALTDKINTIADARISMFKSISANANVMHTGISQSRVDLVNQMTLLQVVEDQLNQAKTKIQTISNRNDTQMRLVEINTYYGNRYEAQSKLMKKIILVCLPLLILFILKKKGILPSTLGNYIIGSVIAVGGAFLMYSIWDIFTRSNMDFNTYDWAYEQPDEQSPTIWQYNKANLFNFDNLFKNLIQNLGLCVGDSCCSPGTVYDSTSFQCIPANASNTVMSREAAQAKLDANKEPFISSDGLLQGTVIKTYMKDNSNGIMPFSYDMRYAAI